MPVAWTGTRTAAAPSHDLKDTRMRLTRTTAVAAGLTGLLCTAASAAPAALAVPTPASPAAHAAVSSVAAATPVVRGAIGVRYAALGGRAGFLGAPLADESPTFPRSGAFQNFRGGSIFWSPSTGAWEVHGAVREKWFSTRAENGPLGFPTSNEVTSTTTAGSASSFERGVVAWSPSTGAHRLSGAVLAAWLELDQEKGVLGFPASEEIALPLVRGTVVQYFSGAAVYWSPETGIGIVRGAIRLRWGQLGFENGPLGLPIGSEILQRDGSVRQQFQGGVLGYSASTGTQVVRIINFAKLDTANKVVLIEGVESQPFRYDGADDAFGRQSVLDPAGIVTPLTQPQFAALFAGPTPEVLVVVTHDPASGRNTFTALTDVSTGSTTAGALHRYLVRVR